MRVFIIFALLVEEEKIVQIEEGEGKWGAV
jgi:hypothetical protein